MRRVRGAVSAVLGAVVIAFVGGVPASADGPLVNVVVTNVLNGNTVVLLQNVTVAGAAAFCDIDVNVLSEQLDKDGKGSCPAYTSVTQIGKVIAV